MIEKSFVRDVLKYFGKTTQSKDQSIVNQVIFITNFKIRTNFSCP